MVMSSPQLHADSVSYYAVLGVSPAASSRDIQRAYHALALSLHPDKHGGGGGEQPSSASLTSELTFQQLQEVYHTLIDEQRRLRYDEQWRGHRLLPPRSSLFTTSPLSCPVPSSHLAVVSCASVSLQPSG